MPVIRQELQIYPVGWIFLEKLLNVVGPFNDHQVRGFKEFIYGETIQFMRIGETIGVHVEQLAIAFINRIDCVGRTCYRGLDPQSSGDASDQCGLAGPQVS